MDPAQPVPLSVAVAVGLVLPLGRLGRAWRGGAGRGRARVGARRGQDGDGFVPHIRYHDDPGHARRASGAGRPPRRSPSRRCTATPSPCCVRRGIQVPGAGHLAGASRASASSSSGGLATPSGLVTLVHPWESGADDSPRWDHWSPGGFHRDRWWQTKGDLLPRWSGAAGGAPVATRRSPVGAGGVQRPRGLQRPGAGADHGGRAVGSSGRRARERPRRPVGR